MIINLTPVSIQLSDAEWEWFENEDSILLFDPLHFKLHFNPESRSKQASNQDWIEKED